MYSDEADFDQHWIAMLADAAGGSRDAVKIGDIKKVIEQIGMPAASTDSPRHRAEADARRLTILLGRQ